MKHTFVLYRFRSYFFFFYMSIFTKNILFNLVDLFYDYITCE